MSSNQKKEHNLWKERDIKYRYWQLDDLKIVFFYIPKYD